MKERKIKKGRKQVEGQVSVSCLFLVPPHVQNDTLPAYPTLVAMEHPFFLAFVIVKGANVTEVSGKVFMALSTGTSLGLLVATPKTLHMRHSMPI